MPVYKVKPFLGDGGSGGGGAQIVDALPAQGVEGTTYLLRKTEEHLPVRFKYYQYVAGNQEIPYRDFIVSDDFTQEELTQMILDKISYNDEFWIDLQNAIPEVLTSEQEQAFLDEYTVTFVSSAEEVSAITEENAIIYQKIENLGIDAFRFDQYIETMSETYLCHLVGLPINSIITNVYISEGNMIIDSCYTQYDSVENHWILIENDPDVYPITSTLTDSYNNDENYWMTAPEGTEIYITLTSEQPTYTYSYTEYVFDKGVYTEVSAKSEGLKYLHTVSAYSYNEADATEDEIIFTFYSTSNTEITTRQQVRDYFINNTLTTTSSGRTWGPTAWYCDSSGLKMIGIFEGATDDLLYFSASSPDSGVAFSWHCKDDDITEYAIEDKVTPM